MEGPTASSPASLLILGVKEGGAPANVSPPLWSLRLRVSRAPVEPVSESTSSTDGLSEMSERVVSSASWTLVGLERASRAPGDRAGGSEGGEEGPPLLSAPSCIEASRDAA